MSRTSRSALPMQVANTKTPYHPFPLPTPHLFAVMSTDSIPEWPDVWNGHGIGWAMPFPATVQLHNPHHSANISPSTSRTSLPVKGSGRWHQSGK